MRRLRTRLFEEYEKPFGRLSSQKHTVNRLFLQSTEDYVSELLLRATARDCEQSTDWFRIGPHHPVNKEMASVLSSASRKGCLRDYLREFVARIAAIAPARLYELSRTGESELRGCLQRYVDDYVTNRPRRGQHDRTEPRPTQMLDPLLPVTAVPVAADEAVDDRKTLGSHRLGDLHSFEGFPVATVADAIGRKAKELLASLPENQRSFNLKAVSPEHWWMV